MVLEKTVANRTFAEEIAVVGGQLQQSREAQSLSLQEISVRTKIQQRLLRAIEAGDLTQLPEPFYVQQFIRRFADALGLDGDKFANPFSIDLTPQPICFDGRESAPGFLRPIHLYILYLLLLAAAMTGLLYLNHPARQFEPLPTSSRVN